MFIAPDLIVDEGIRCFLECVVRRLESLAPGCFVAYYLTGSHADGTAVSASDVDLVALVRSQELWQEKGLCESKADFSRVTPVRLNLQIQDLETLARSQRSLALLRWGSVLLLGEDCRPELPAIDVDGFTHESLSLSRCFMALGRPRSELNAPFDHPDLDDEFYGRTRVRIPSLYQFPAEEGTKELLKEILWSVTSLLAVQFRVVVGSARQAVERYQEEAGAWWQFVHDSTRMCKHAWNYEVPRGARERVELRSFCRQLLDFENYCLSTYACWEQKVGTPIHD